ncbi:DUF4012 domain-containing protein [Microbacterium sp. NPDC058389]|uniref:DUF4012 domain-containing protein n=1 Tax=Microbacterium sp. NPDC058389 TaxID=3346475 RepID=UPI003658F650
MSSKPVPGRFRQGRAGNHAPAPRRRRRWPWVLLGTFVVLGGIAAVGGVFALQALQVKDDLMAAKSQLTSLTDAYKDGDAAEMQAIGAEALRLTTEAESTVQGPLWGLAAGIPVVGTNITAVRAATEATHIIVRDALPSGIQLLSTMSPDKLKVEGGGINLVPFQEAQQTLPELKSVLAAAQTKVSNIDRGDLLPVVDDAVEQLSSVVDQAGPLLDTVEQLLPIALRMAGSEGPRNYLVIFQNNAEIRATGGNAATSTVIHAENGKIEKVEDETVEDFYLAGVSGWLDSDLPDETLALYEEDFDRNAQNFSRTPDFPTTAHMFSQLWEQTNGTQLDGVISLDPVALSYMLAATGPVELEDGSEINGKNAVKLLLSDAYEKFGTNGKAADAYFADVSSRVFDKIASGSWAPTAMIKMLERSVNEDRIYAYFPREDENALATEFKVDGALTADNTKATQVGIYLNDASYSKLEYYLSTTMNVTCDAASRTMTTTLTMTSTVPGNNLSGYTLAWRNPSMNLPRTTMILDTLYVAPPGSTITAINPADGDIRRWNRDGAEKGHPLASRTMLLKMGETKTVSFTTQLPEGELGPLEVRYSPTVTQTPVTIDASCSALFPESK